MLKRFNRGQKSFDAPKEVKTVGREATPNADPWTLVSVIYDGGDQGYSVAIGTTPGGKRVCAVRWNGNYDHQGKGELPDTGTPAQGNFARWFVLPEFLIEPVIAGTYDYMRKNAVAWVHGTLRPQG